MMKKFILLSCLLCSALAAQAQFEKGKWMISPTLSGFHLSYDTGDSSASLAIEGTGGWFVADNIALTAYMGASWNDINYYKIGAGARYYFDKVGFFAGGSLGAVRWDGTGNDDTDFSFVIEGGYAFFLSRTVTVEPSVYWDIQSDTSFLGLKIGFGFYF
jgi:hypothetical protein